MNKKWKIISASSALVIVLAAVAFAFFKPAQEIVKSVTSKVGDKPKLEAQCPLDGLPTTTEKSKQKPLGVMVENLSSIRPQKGLSKACIVFEALAEGGITRFLVMFNHNDVENIGPVRSARPYYIALATGFDVVYAHAGGSTVGLQKISEYGVDDFDQFKFSKAYWRQKGINAPHNLFTSTEKIRTVAKEAGLEDASFDGWGFDKKKLKGKNAKDISISFSSKAYHVQYKYDAKSKRYKRFNGSKAHLDANNNNKQIAPSSVVVVRASTSMYDAQTLNIAIIGEGEGHIFKNGKSAPIKWKKESASSQITFEDLDGEEVKFSPGQIWVEVVKLDTPVSFK